ncbi:hypothetical protein [Sphingomonas sp.]
MNRFAATMTDILFSFGSRFPIAFPGEKAARYGSGAYLLPESRAP